MLSLLTDAHISPHLAEQVRANRPEIIVYNLQEWRGGVLLQAADDIILTAATEEGLTLVTYDQRAIAPMITQWAMERRNHGGVIFIDDRSIAQEDVGDKVHAFISLWEQGNALDWTNAISYLNPDS